ncbi:hypothetical protein VTK26DRAFT_7541 [Humicola hyalothermophila]
MSPTQKGDRTGRPHRSVLRRYHQILLSLDGNNSPNTRRKTRKTEVSDSQGENELLLWAPTPSDKKLEQIFGSRVISGQVLDFQGAPQLPPIVNTPAFLPFDEMVRSEIDVAALPSTVSRARQSPRAANEMPRKTHTRESDTPAVDRPRRTVYDGLRSSPWESAEPHVWKEYTGSDKPTKEENDSSSHSSSTQQPRLASREPICSSTTPANSHPTAASRIHPKQTPSPFHRPLDLIALILPKHPAPSPSSPHQPPRHHHHHHQP